MTRKQLAILVALFGLAALLFILGSRGTTPTTAAPPSLIEQARERQEPPKVRRTGPRPRPVAAYTKREGLHVDIPYLSGRRVREVPPAVFDDQFGAELSREELPEDEEYIVYEKLEVWTHAGRIFRIRKKLAHPMDIPTALGTSGFPLDLGMPVDATTEARWNHVWNQRRLRLLKSEGDPRLYVTIESLKYFPKELL